MRCFHIQPGGVREDAAWPTAPPDQGFLWVACERDELRTALPAVHASLQACAGVTLVDLHVSDLLNPQLPSHYDYTSQYDLLVFRRLANGLGERLTSDVTPAAAAAPGKPGTPDAMSVLQAMDTSPVGFAVFDRVLLTVHPPGCAVLAYHARRLLSASGTGTRAADAQLPLGPADLMLRVVNHMVDGFLALRRELTNQLDHWQTALLHPKARFNDWSALLDARTSLHQLDQICEDQHGAIQNWIEALEDWEVREDGSHHFGGHRGLDLLQVRSRDVLEHIERVTRHVRRLEQNVETAVQMHFSVQGNRTNDIMRTLTALTAIFLPLNLIAGIFGMNFEFIPFLHLETGFWWAMGTMALIAVLLSALFWRKRYLARSAR
jgi:Mg2+ and Co2+ transporter CorA